MATNENQQPDIFDSIEQDGAGDVGDSSYIPPDEPLGVHAYGTTSAEERAGETFAQRTHHRNPEVFEIDDLSEPTDSVGRLLQPGDEDIDSVDNESAAIALDGGADGDDLSAEEAAMHTTEI